MKTERHRGAVLCVLTLFATLLLGLTAHAEVPPRPEPPQLVNDMAGILSQTDEMEDSLQRFAMHTGNQIVVITVADLGDYEPWEYAQQIGQTWGVGGQKFNNGVVVLIKPKTEHSKGRAFIATGYGLEGALPDALCTRIVNNEMIPAFKQDDYTAGVWAALSVIMPIASGEYNEKEYSDNSDDILFAVSDIIAIIVVILIIIIIACNIHDDSGKGSGSGGRRRSGTWGGPIVWSSGSSWGSGSSSWGSGSFGGGGSSWGGFGGGSFGGGGGGGSW